MAESVLWLARALRAALISFQADGCSGEECASLVEELAAVEKVSAAARVRAAARAGACGIHRERGFADVPQWLAKVTGATAGSAKTALHTVAALESQPEAAAALSAGELSLAQAGELVKIEAAVPGSGAALLDMAKGETLRALKDEARGRRLRSIDPEELHALQHARMHHRHWVTALGNIAYSGELPPELGIPFVNVLDAETDRLWRAAHQKVDSAAEVSLDTGESETEPPRAALAARALVEMIKNGGGKGKANRAELVIVCDLRAYRRGHAHEGEPCHIVGGGPIPVALAKELGRDAFLKAVLHDGTAIHTIAHFGRRCPAVLRTALNLGGPPEFDGNTCAAAGCSRRYHLQDDHIDPVANGGRTSYSNSQPLCPPHHRMKTDCDRKAGLLSGTPPHTGARNAELARAGPGPASPAK